MQLRGPLTQTKCLIRNLLIGLTEPVQMSKSGKIQPNVSFTITKNRVSTYVFEKVS